MSYILKLRAFVYVTVLLTALFVLAEPSWAATIMVDTTADIVTTNGQCSLREAVINANSDNQSGSTDCVAGSGADTIVLQSGQTYTLSLDSTAGNEDAALEDDLDITSDITIQGNGATIQRSSSVTCTLNETIVSGEFRIFQVTNTGNLTLDRVTVSNGCADRPNFGGELDSTGGGIFNDSGTVTITNSTISGNSSLRGGGIENDIGTVIIINSTVSGNTASNGGGILNYYGTATITNSTISSNYGSAWGGGILNYYGTATIINSTISGNSGDGGIHNPFGTVSITSCTISDNGDEYSSGGIANGGSATIKNSIVANNMGTNCWGINSTSVNFATDGTCTGFTQATSVQLNLGPLADNGGPTHTHALQDSSVAIDAVTDCTDLSASPDSVTQDQRGISRPQGTSCDAGAYEAALHSGGGNTFTVTITKTGTGKGTVTSSPTDIDCGDICSATYNFGYDVTLTATPAGGSTFAGWSGGGCMGTGVCIVKMDEQKDISASFKKKFPWTMFLPAITKGKP